MKYFHTSKLPSTDLTQNRNCSISKRSVPSSAMIEKKLLSQIVKTFNLKTLEAIMCNSPFWMSWCVYLCHTCPWKCLVTLSSFVSRRYKILVRLLLSRACNGILWRARYRRYMTTSTRYLPSNFFHWVIWSSIISPTSLPWGAIN